MPPINLTLLATEYSVHDAALIIAGYDPEAAYSCADKDVAKRFPGYIKALNALRRAVTTRRLEAVLVVYRHDDFNGDQDVNIYETLLSIEALRGFLAQSGQSCIEFREVTAELDTTHNEGKFVSKKLIAANKAWAAVTNDPKLLKGKSPKQALTIWLTAHAAELGLVNRNGEPNRGGIEEVCKVANWKPEGGATPTALGPPPPEVVINPVPVPDRGRKEEWPPDLDDDIPF